MGDEVEPTRCRDIEGGDMSMVATRARWRVGSNSRSSEKRLELDMEEAEGAGERGTNAVVMDGTRTGKVVVVVVVEDAEDSVSDGEGGDVSRGGTVVPVVRPWAASALTTASQPFSRVLMRSLSSIFSFSQKVCWPACGCSVGSMPARRRRFSSSSSDTRRWR
jgi:hypothetical protein